MKLPPRTKISKPNRNFAMTFGIRGDLSGGTFIKRPERSTMAARVGRCWDAMFSEDPVLKFNMWR
jgi:hypothetical protein